MRRWLLTAIAAVAATVAPAEDKPVQNKDKKQAAPQQQQEEVPPEEDEGLAPKVYTFNPLQADKEIRIGGFYFKKGSYKAAARRFEEATKWNPGLADAFLKWGEALEKLRNKPGAHDAYAKFVELAPDDKRAPEIKRKLEKLK
jgi:tetratricopeptide (TPR) repeat protein